MKKHILLVVFFTLLIVVIFDILFGIFWSWSISHNQSGSFFKISHSLFENTAPALAVGSSFCEYGFIPSILRDSLGIDCWNAGREKQSLPYYDLIARYSTKRYSPDLIIQFISPRELENEYSRTALLQLKPVCWKHEDFRNLLYPDSWFRRNLLKSSIAANNSSIYNLIRPFFAQVDGSIQTGGFKRMDRVFPGSTSTEPPQEPMRQTLNPEGIATLRNLLQLYLESQSLIVIVIPPFYQCFFDTTPTIDELKRIESSNPSVVLMNFSHDRDFLEKNDLFMDRHHLNFQGAKVLTQKITRQLLESGTYAPKQ